MWKINCVQPQNIIPNQKKNFIIKEKYREKERKGEREF